MIQLLQYLKIYDGDYMCNYFNLKILLVLILPIIYLISFLLYKGEHKNNKKGIIITTILFLICLSIYSIIFLFTKNKCDIKEDITTSTTTTSTKKIYKYENVPEIEGERVRVGTTKKGYTIYEINGVTYIEGIMIANKTYALPEDYYPTNTHVDASNVDNTCNECLVETVYQAYLDMRSDARSVGLYLENTSGYRSYETQEYIYNRYVLNDCKKEADTYSSRPGHSDHQTGLAFDLNSIDDTFIETDEGKWVNDNAYKYGFIIRFPKGKEKETGYKYESWHLRYVGEEIAGILYNDGNWLSLEEYLGITSEYQD